MIEEKIRATVRDVPDFPKPGIVFKDITPVLLDAALCREISAYLKEYYSTRQIDLVLGVESRGFFFGLRLANDLNVPFAPVRKKCAAIPITHATAPLYFVETTNPSARPAKR